MFNNRGRGASVQASNSVVRGNNMQHLGSYEGITVSPNGIYAESEFPSNVVVGRPRHPGLLPAQPLVCSIHFQTQAIRRPNVCKLGALRAMSAAHARMLAVWHP